MSIKGTHIKHLDQCLAHSKLSTNARCYYSEDTDRNYTSTGERGIPPAWVLGYQGFEEELLLEPGLKR